MKRGRFEAEFEVSNDMQFSLAQGAGRTAAASVASASSGSYEAIPQHQMQSQPPQQQQQQANRLPKACQNCHNVSALTRMSNVLLPGRIYCI